MRTWIVLFQVTHNLRDKTEDDKNDDSIRSSTFFIPNQSIFVRDTIAARSNITTITLPNREGIQALSSKLD